MKTKIAIIGGGIVGSTVAYYLSQLKGHQEIEVTMFDDGHGQATKAAAGIICPWLSKRRNKQWYHLARAGAQLLPKLAKTTAMPANEYNQSGGIITRSTDDAVNAVYQLAIQRKVNAPTMGQIRKLTAQQVKDQIPVLDHSQPGVMVTGGARINGQKLSEHLIKIAQKRNLAVIPKNVQMVNDHELKTTDHDYKFSKIVVATGAWIRKTLLPLGIKADIRPQKGQLIRVHVRDTPEKENMPVLMPEGEYDFLPFGHGQLVIGATHEDQMGFDLRPNHTNALKLLSSAQKLVDHVTPDDIDQVRTGTRGYTGDYRPFFGAIPQHPDLLTGGGLGSSGLTTGPIIGKFLAQMILTDPVINFDYYEKPIKKYFRFND